MDEKRYNVGIMGYGWVSAAHIAAINATSSAEVTAVCSARPLDAGELSARHGGAIKVYQDLEKMLADRSLQVRRVIGEPARFRGGDRSPLPGAVRGLFFEALSKDEEMPHTSLAHAMRMHEVIFAADQSAERHAHRKHPH